MEEEGEEEVEEEVGNADLVWGVIKNIIITGPTLPLGGKGICRCYT